jgi:hypothetical protein
MNIETFGIPSQPWYGEALQASITNFNRDYAAAIGVIRDADATAKAAEARLADGNGSSTDPAGDMATIREAIATRDNALVSLFAFIASRDAVQVDIEAANAAAVADLTGRIDSRAGEIRAAVAGFAFTGSNVVDLLVDGEDTVRELRLSLGTVFRNGWSIQESEWKGEISAVARNAALRLSKQPATVGA